MTGGSISPIVGATAHDLKLVLAVGELVEARVVNVLDGGRAVLGIRGKLVTAATDVALEKNSVATFKVADVAKDHVTLQFQGYRETPKGTNAVPGSDLVPGSILRGIIGKNAEGSPVIVLPRGDIPVRPEMPLSQGAQVFVRVVPGEQGPEFELVRHNVPPAASPQAQDAQAAGVPAKWRALSKVTAAFEQVVERLRGLGIDAAPLEEGRKNFPDIADLTPVTLKHALEKGGVLLEAKLRRALQFPEQATVVADDLKGRLLQAAKLLDEAGAQGKPVIGAKEEVRQLLQQIENYQLLSAAENSLKTFLPLMWPGLNDGDLEFRKTADGDASSCRVNLDLAEHGELSIMILFSGSFSVYLRPQAEAFRTILAANLGRLQEMFAASGLPLRNVDVVDPGSRVLEQMEEGMAPGGEVRVMV